MRSFAARILVLVLVLSQTWTGALRGIELCIPIGGCGGCADSGSHAHDHAHGQVRGGGLHRANRHASGHPSAHAHAHAHADRAGHVHAVAHGEDGCLCHIHVDTPDDDSHRRAAPSARLVLLAGPVGSSGPRVTVREGLGSVARPESPPERDGPTRTEHAVIASTVLLL